MTPCLYVGGLVAVVAAVYLFFVWRIHVASKRKEQAMDEYDSAVAWLMDE